LPSHHSAPKLGVDPGACALIGDADSDLAMASAAGIPHRTGYTALATKPKLAGGTAECDHWSSLTVQANPPITPEAKTSSGARHSESGKPDGRKDAGNRRLKASGQRLEIILE